MSLNIKNTEGHRLASEIAQLTGQSMTAIVIDALRQQLKHIQRQKQKEKRVQELMAIGQRCAAHIKQPITSQKHGDMLYGTDGLPQ
ncbi:type II toxin-antitoxin system VapB family antitoxin [Chloroflexi bacterium TSY]|nr:type II toxin-antitoxin system VapB family antitoxin [Chloroflexi bacterium TSY]